MPHTLRQPLSRLIYTSRFSGLPDTQDTRERIRDIAAASARRNHELGITGSLTFVDGTFVQLLEGPHDAVEQTFERICHDFRHEDIKLVDLTDTPTRLFDDWDMAYMSDIDKSSGPAKEDLQELKYLLGVNVREAVAQMRRHVEAAVPATEH